MYRIVAMVIAMFFLMIAGAAGLAPVASADDVCNTANVVDNSKNELLSRNPDIKKQADKLALDGATVRIRLLESYDGDTESYVATMQAQCRDWRELNTPDLRHNLVAVVVILAVNGDYSQRRVGVFAGKDWLNNDKLTSIRVDTMAPVMHGFDHNNATTYDDIPNGVAAGETKLAEQIDSQLHPSYMWVLWVIIIVIVLVVLVLWIGGGSSRRGSRGGSYTSYSGFSSYSSGGGDSGGGGGGGGGDSSF